MRIDLEPDATTTLSSDKLTEINANSKSFRLNHPYNEEEAKTRFINLLKYITSIKAVTVCFSDIEGRLHMLDYDKDFLLESADNLTFDGSSIRGFTDQKESDLRLSIDWNSVYVIPWGEQGEQINKVTVFSTVHDRNGNIFLSDFRARLKELLKELHDVNNMTVNVAAEIEGFLFKEKDAEKKYPQTRSFDFVNSGGYFDTLPKDSLRMFIDAAAQIQRCIGFENEKDHPEVAPSQFELNWKYTEALVAADQIQLYKLICRRVARNMGYTASFLPKPVAGINGSGMHTNISIYNTRTNTNDFYDKSNGLSNFANKFINGVLNHAKELCLIWNSSVNSYRRLDPNYEAPNEITASAIDRGALIRIPVANENSTRIEVRAVSPDTNPYLHIYATISAGLHGKSEKPKIQEALPRNIYEAINCFTDSSFIRQIMNQTTKDKFIKWKQASADRCPKQLGSIVKISEIMFHHEVTNQYLWNMF